jgi:hypothetical protein
LKIIVRKGVRITVKNPAHAFLFFFALFPGFSGFNQFFGSFEGILSVFLPPYHHRQFFEAYFPVESFDMAGRPLTGGLLTNAELRVRESSDLR